MSCKKFFFVITLFINCKIYSQLFPGGIKAYSKRHEVENVLQFKDGGTRGKYFGIISGEFEVVGSLKISNIQFYDIKCVFESDCLTRMYLSFSSRDYENVILGLKKKYTSISCYPSQSNNCFKAKGLEIRVVKGNTDSGNCLILYEAIRESEF